MNKEVLKLWYSFVLDCFLAFSIGLLIMHNAVVDKRLNEVIVEKDTLRGNIENLLKFCPEWVNIPKPISAGE